MRVFAVLTAALLAACAPPPELTIEERAEQTAAAAVSVLFPETDPLPVANCVRDLAEFEELITLANGSPETPEDETIALVDEILERAEVAYCVRFNNVVLGV